jgi:hypothetical protein
VLVNRISKELGEYFWEDATGESSSELTLAISEMLGSHAQSLHSLFIKTRDFYEAICVGVSTVFLQKSIYIGRHSTRNDMSMAERTSMNEQIAPT